MPPSARSAQLKEKMNPSWTKQFWVPYLVFGNCILYVGAMKDFNSSTPDCQGQNANKLFALSAFLLRNLPPKNGILRQFLTPKRKSNPEGFAKMDPSWRWSWSIKNTHQPNSDWTSCPKNWALQASCQHQEYWYQLGRSCSQSGRSRPCTAGSSRTVVAHKIWNLGI